MERVFEFPRWQKSVPFSHINLEHLYMVDRRLKGIRFNWLNINSDKHQAEVTRLIAARLDVSKKLTKKQKLEYESSTRFLPNPR